MFKMNLLLYNMKVKITSKLYNLKIKKKKKFVQSKNCFFFVIFSF